jgi:hypothetical protein
MEKEKNKNHKEVMIIGIVREIENIKNSYRVGIATGNETYVVKLNEEGKNLLYEVGNKVEATGIITKTKDGICRIDVSGYEVYEMDEEDLEEFGIDPDYYLSHKNYF